LLRHDIERIIPGNRLESSCTFVAFAAQRLLEPVGMMHAFGVAGDLRADHARRVCVVLRSSHAADGPPIQEFNLQCTGGGAIVGARRSTDSDWLRNVTDQLVHSNRYNAARCLCRWASKHTDRARHLSCPPAGATWYRRVLRIALLVREPVEDDDIPAANP